MADTVGTLVDKLFTVDTKMWNGQEELYKIRRMTYEEFENEFLRNESKSRRLFEVLQRACDLNVQRNQLVNEIDLKLIELVQAALAGEELDNGSNVQRHHKTY
jgi:hypothetical protein